MLKPSELRDSRQGVMTALAGPPPYQNPLWPAGYLPRKEHAAVVVVTVYTAHTILASEAMRRAGPGFSSATAKRRSQMPLSLEFDAGFSLHQRPLSWMVAPRRRGKLETLALPASLE